MFGQINYGGRITDPLDNRLINTLVNIYFNHDILLENYTVFENINCKPLLNLDLNSIYKFIDELPNENKAEMFDLSPNTEIKIFKNTNKYFFNISDIYKTISKVYPLEIDIEHLENQENKVL